VVHGVVPCCSHVVHCVAVMWCTVLQSCAAPCCSRVVHCVTVINSYRETRRRSHTSPDAYLHIRIHIIICIHAYIPLKQENSETQPLVASLFSYFHFRAVFLDTSIKTTWNLTGRHFDIPERYQNGSRHTHARKCQTHLNARCIWGGFG